MTDLLALELLFLLALIAARRIPFVARHQWKLLAGGIAALQALALLLWAAGTEGSLRESARPILGSRPVPAFEGDLSIRPAGHRILSVAGRPVETLSDFARALEGVPQGGVVPMRAMDPGPDKGVRTVLLWTARLDRHEAETVAAAAAKMLEASLDPARPRLAPPPWGIAEPILGLTRIAGLTRLWNQVPMQFYALDVAPQRVPGFLPFRLASLLTALLVSLLLARGIGRVPGGRLRAAEAPLALLLTILLEAASLFVFP